MWNGSMGQWVNVTQVHSLIQIQRYRKDQFIQVIKTTVESQEHVQ